MRRSSYILIALLSVCAAGCEGLTPGQMNWVQPVSQEPRAGNVYLVRGLIGVFSTGMDELAEQMNHAGVRARVFQDNQNSFLADAIVKEYKGVKDPEPLVLVGHSYGADDVVKISRVLAENGIRVDLLITIDATVPPNLPDNVSVCYNYFQSQPTDFIPMFRGIPLTPDHSSSVKLYNWDLRKDRTDLLEPGTNHINIDKNPLLHQQVVQQVLDVCVPRPVWAAAHGANTAMAQTASDKRPPQQSPAAANSSAPDAPQAARIQSGAQRTN